jgi:arylsulfatase A-like enzyme
MLSQVDQSKLPRPLIPATDISRSPYGVRYESDHSYLGAFRKFTPEQIRRMRTGYLASIALFDLEVGRVLAALDEKGIADNTLVLFTSDHGDMLGDHRLLVKGAFFYDPGVRVPLLIRWPNAFQGGRRIRQVVQPHDLAATALAAAGWKRGDIDEAMPESQSLLPACGGAGAQLRNSAICCYRNSGIFDDGNYADPPIHATMLREERYKLNIYHSPLTASGNVEGELYDMAEDPSELRNLWEDKQSASIRQRMSDRLLAWLSRQEQRLGARGGEMRPGAGQKLPNSLQ